MQLQLWRQRLARYIDVASAQLQVLDPRAWLADHLEEVHVDWEKPW